MRRLSWRRAALLALALALAACGRHDWRNANIVVIAIDTLRADHVGAYGYPRPTTPRIDEFAKRGVVFETAIAQSSWTMPSFASMFTGLLPSYHRAGEGRFPVVSKLDETPATLAAILAAHGYKTASFVSNEWVGAAVGMARGFERHQFTMLSEDAEKSAIAWLHDAPAEPFFLFVHFIDPHQPYIPTAEDLALFADPTYHGPVGTGFMGDAKPEWNDADRRRVVDLYDGEVRWSDRLTGKVLDTLTERGLDDRTIVVVVSDHGEELGERGKFGHGHTLYDELLHVPLVIRFPGGPRRRVAHQVRAMDLFATLLDAVGQPVPTNVQAVSLMPLVRGEPAAPACDLALAEYICFGPNIDLKAARTPTHKLLVSAVTGDTHLFDLETDPGERHDVAKAEPQVASALAQQVQRNLVASLEGYHLIAVGGRQDSVVRARFAALTTFRDVELSQPERGDAFRLSYENRILDVKLHLVRGTQRLAGPDVDGIRFRTVGDKLVNVTRLELDGAVPSWGQITVGDGKLQPLKNLPWRFVPAPPNVVRYPITPPVAFNGQPQIRLSFVQRGAAPTADVSPETRDRLRALGYVP